MVNIPLNPGHSVVVKPVNPGPSQAVSKTTIQTATTKPPSNTSRRTLLQTALFGTFAAAVPETLVAQNQDTPQVKPEKDLSSDELRPKPGDIAKALSYDGFSQWSAEDREDEFKLSGNGRDIRMRILNSLKLKDWNAKTITANPIKGNLGFVEDLAKLASCELAADPANMRDIKESNIANRIDRTDYFHKLDAIEKFGAEIKSARLASLIAGATAARFIYRLSSKNEPTKLIKALDDANFFLEVLGYNSLDTTLEHKQAIEDCIIKAMYGPKRVAILYKAFPLKQFFEDGPVTGYDQGGISFWKLDNILANTNE